MDISDNFILPKKRMEDLPMQHGVAPLFGWGLTFPHINGTIDFDDSIIFIFIYIKRNFLVGKFMKSFMINLKGSFIFVKLIISNNSNIFI